MQSQENLDALRDQKCFPIVRTILQEMATDLAKEEGNHNELALKTLSLFLAEDLNIDTEVSYIPQVLLGTLSGLNATIQGCDIVPNDDARYSAIAQKILVLLAQADIKLDAMTPEETITAFAPLREQLNALFAEEKVTRMEVEYIIKNILEAFAAFNNLVSSSMEGAVRRAEAKVLGIDSMSDLTTQKVDEILKAKSE